MSPGSKLTRSKTTTTTTSNGRRRVTPPRGSPLVRHDSTTIGTGSSYTKSKQLPSPPRTNTPNWTNAGSSSNGGGTSGNGYGYGTSPRVSTPQRRGSISTQSRNRSESPEKHAVHPSQTISSIHTRKGPQADETLQSLLLPASSSTNYHPGHMRSNSNSTMNEGRKRSNSAVSLIHLMPVLASLGMTTSSHLKAVARLSPETRDREVKEEALRRGVTVVEWAVLVDRIMGWEGRG